MSEALLADRYKLVRLIGEGGYGTVWLARDEQLRRDVAIKKLSISDTSKKETQKKIDRFRHEAITMAKIDHANVVTIYDVGTIEGAAELFLVMELLEGRSLLEELHTIGPLAPTRALDRFVETLEGLQAAHDVGVVHKDLKPANLFLHRVDTAREKMKLIDFGIARMDSLTKLTGTGRMAGSPRYLAPEYIMGESVTPAIDIYQTALILVEALSGEPCIRQGLKYFEVCERHILSQLDIPEPLLDSPIGPILDRALQRNPLDRYRSAEEFADELTKLRPEELPAFDLGKTTEMKAVSLDDLEFPSSEETVSGMVDRLREEEAALRPDVQTRRFAGIIRPSAPDEDDKPTRPDRPAVASASQTPRALAAPDMQITRPAHPAVSPESIAPPSRPMPSPPSPSQAPPKTAEPTRTQLRVMAVVALLIAFVVIAGTAVMRNVQGDPVVDRSLPPSEDTCLLRCNQWYQDLELRGSCQDLCRGTRPPTEPPFPIVDRAAAEVSEPAGEQPVANDEQTPEPESAPAPEPEADVAAPEVTSKPARITIERDTAKPAEPARPAKFAPRPQKFEDANSKERLNRELDKMFGE